MMRKTYGSLPKAHGAQRRGRVRCALSIESSSVRIDPDFLKGVSTSEELASAAGQIYDWSLEETFRFRRALQEYSAQHLVETLVEGLLELTQREIEGFSICPLVTESIRCLALNRAEAQVEVNFCAAILTFYTVADSAVARAQGGQLELYRTYYKDILLKYVTRRLEESLDPSARTRMEAFEALVTETLGRILQELRRVFPLEPYQDRYERAPVTPDDKAGVVRKICRDMKSEARRRLGIA
jgi:hypothetical protein